MQQEQEIISGVLEAPSEIVGDGRERGDQDGLTLVRPDVGRVSYARNLIT